MKSIMLRLQRHSFSLYHQITDPMYYHHLQTKQLPLRRIPSIVDDIIKCQLNTATFEKIWTKYAYMVEKSYENDKVASVEEARSALLTLAMIAEKYPEHHSSKMNKVMNQLTTRCLQTSYNDVHEFIKIVAAVASYNPNKACALFLKNCKIVEGNVSKLERQDCYYLAKIFKATGVNVPLLREILIEVVYDNINSLSIVQLGTILEYLADSHKFVNRELIKKIGDRIFKLFQSNAIYDNRLLICVCSLAIIEKNLKTDSPYEHSLDRCFESIFLYFSTKFSTLKDYSLSQLIIAIRKSGYYNTTLLANLQEECMRREVKELSTQYDLGCQDQKTSHLLQKRRYEEKSKSKWKVSLNTMLNLFHTFAYQNWKSLKFNKYLIELMALMAQLDKHRLTLANASDSYLPSPTSQQIFSQTATQTPTSSRTKTQNSKHKLQITLLPTSSQKIGTILWSMCVLCSPSELAPLYSWINSLFIHQSIIAKSSILSYYYCYLYLRQVYPSINKHRDYIHTIMKDNLKQLVAYQSRNQQELHQTLLDLGIPCLEEFMIGTFLVDILIPEWSFMKNIVIDFHGFHHFTRNQKVHTGSTELKKKLLELDGYIYTYVGLDQWIIVEDKKMFMKEFLEALELNFWKKQFKENKTSSGKASKRRQSSQQIIKSIKQQLIPQRLSHSMTKDPSNSQNLQPNNELNDQPKPKSGRKVRRTTGLSA